MLEFLGGTAGERAGRGAQPRASTPFLRSISPAVCPTHYFVVIFLLCFVFVVSVFCL